MKLSEKSHAERSLRLGTGHFWIVLNRSLSFLPVTVVKALFSVHTYGYINVLSIHNHCSVLLYVFPSRLGGGDALGWLLWLTQRPWKESGEETGNFVP